MRDCEDTYETTRVLRSALYVIRLRTRPARPAVRHATSDGFRGMRHGTEERQELWGRHHWHRQRTSENAHAALSGISPADRSHCVPHPPQSRQEANAITRRRKGTVPHRQDVYETSG